MNEVKLETTMKHECSALIQTDSNFFFKTNKYGYDMT